MGKDQVCCTIMQKYSILESIYKAFAITFILAIALLKKQINTLVICYSALTGSVFVIVPGKFAVNKFAAGKLASGIFTSENFA